MRGRTIRQPTTTRAVRRKCEASRAARQKPLRFIDDLRFHDLRHTGISRLFEMGRTIPQVACVSAHRSWSSLKRYAHIRQSGDRLTGWSWCAVASIPAQMVTGSTVTHVRAVETRHGTARGDIDANQARGYPRCRRKGEPPVSQGEE